MITIDATAENRIVPGNYIINYSRKGGWSTIDTSSLKSGIYVINAGDGKPINYRARIFPECNYRTIASPLNNCLFGPIRAFQCYGFFINSNISRA